MIRLVSSLVLTAAIGCGAARLPDLKISADRRFLVTADGAPFFWLGDTAWELFHRLNREDAAYYLKNRADKGFTVVLAVALAEYEYDKPNAYGDFPLQDNNPDQPSDRYFQHVDWIVDKAAELGLYTGLLPSWGDKWNQKWGKGPEVFTPENAYRYGQWLGRRYRDKPVIWVIGGDRPPETDRHVAILRAMARGLRDGDGGRHLMTFHPQRDKPPVFHAEDWVDFDLFQSGHFRYDSPVYDTMMRHRDLVPTKPVLNGEPNYEETAVRSLDLKAWFDAVDVRKAGYWSMLSGACGHTYGHNSMWQLLDPQSRFAPATHAHTPWRTAADAPGAIQMGIMKRLFESLPWQELVPDQSVLAGEPGIGSAHQCASRHRDGSLALIYSPLGAPIEVRMHRLTPARVRARWFDPTSGAFTAIGDFASTGTHLFTPAQSGREHDTLLVLDAAR